MLGIKKLMPSSRVMNAASKLDGDDNEADMDRAAPGKPQRFSMSPRSISMPKVPSLKSTKGDMVRSESFTNNKQSGVENVHVEANPVKSPRRRRGQSISSKLSDTISFVSGGGRTNAPFVELNQSKLQMSNVSRGDLQSDDESETYHHNAVKRSPIANIKRLSRPSLTNLQRYMPGKSIQEKSELHAFASHQRKVSPHFRTETIYSVDHNGSEDMDDGNTLQNRRDRSDASGTAADLGPQVYHTSIFDVDANDFDAQFDESESASPVDDDDETSSRTSMCENPFATYDHS